ncbi:HesB/YadR/YfhF family protein [Ornithinibacillus salinisoli]|uniref:HesB/YadR/YfhF family protein n=1 Tax=Ornithinibacillus salinisoli TaxID=1848459 RepID=A0ABW4W156_9BACI
MTLKVSTEAAQWFIDEMDLERGDHVQFFLKIYGGIPTAHPNYFIGISYGNVGNIKISTEVEGITFYFNEEDSWLLEQYEMEVVHKNDEVAYIFNEL